jgi:linoleoyl-CoA desaturase
MTSTKILYFLMFVVLPMIVVGKWYLVLLGFAAMHLVAGFLITIIFQLAHVVEGPEHFVITEKKEMENTWAIHQISTTANFATKNKLLTWLCGGLNHQIEHHLFPKISHVHYPNISKIVKKTVAEFDLPYYEFNRMGEAIVSHLKMLKQYGTA